METIYAQALWQMVEKGMKPKEVVMKLRESLENRGRVILMPKIARAFARIAEREHRKRAVTLSVAHEKDALKAEREVKKVLEELGASAEDIEVHVDDSLIGGWRLEGREWLLDASYKKSLLSIYNRATQ